MKELTRVSGSLSRVLGVGRELQERSAAARSRDFVLILRQLLVGEEGLPHVLVEEGEREVDYVFACAGFSFLHARFVLFPGRSVA